MTTSKESQNKPKIIDKENKFHAYCNHTGIATTNFDITLMFGEVQTLIQSELTILMHGSVTMSPQHAKLFSQSLVSAIDEYEKRSGEIKSPDMHGHK